ncbi:MAG: beta-methylgalactoside transporter, partial [Clostridium sp.]|nr:beta-methylgalactoside transporter [Clostridium sp.]
DYSGKFFPNLPDFGNAWGLGVLAVLLICVAVCCFFGFINGIVISYLQVPAFIGTLGMQLIVYGVCLVYTNATPIGGYHSAYTAVAKGKLFGVIPFLFLIALAVGLVMWFIYNMTPHGKYMYAIGGNEQSAEVSGVNTKKTKIIIYMTAAALYALGGFLVGAKSGGSSVNMGYGWELEAIAACTIGGVSVNGGIGRISGVLIGVLVFEILKTCLQYLGVDTNYQYIAQGIVIVVAIALDIRKYIAKK